MTNKYSLVNGQATSVLKWAEFQNANSRRKINWEKRASGAQKKRASLRHSGSVECQWSTRCGACVKRWSRSVEVDMSAARSLHNMHTESLQEKKFKVLFVVNLQVDKLFRLIQFSQSGLKLLHFQINHESNKTIPLCDFFFYSSSPSRSPFLRRLCSPL